MSQPEKVWPIIPHRIRVEYPETGEPLSEQLGEEIKEYLALVLELDLYRRQHPQLSRFLDALVLEHAAKTDDLNRVMPILTKPSA